MKKVNTDRTVTAFRMVLKAKLTKMDEAEKKTMNRALRSMKKVATEFEEFLKDTSEHLRPEGLDAIAAKIQEKKELTEEERTVWNKYNSEVSSCLDDELKKEHELFETFTEETIDRFFASNDFTVSEMMFLSEYFGDE